MKLSNWVGASSVMAFVLAACGEEPKLRGQNLVTDPGGNPTTTPPPSGNPTNSNATAILPPSTLGGGQANWYDSMGFSQPATDNAAPRPTGTAPDQAAVTSALNSIFTDIINAANRPRTSTATATAAPSSPTTATGTAPGPTTATQPDPIPVPPSTSTTDACAVAANQNLTFSGIQAQMQPARGHMHFDLMAPAPGRTMPQMSIAYADFEGTVAQNDWEVGSGGFAYQGGKIRNGRSVWGRLTLTGSVGSLVAVVVLDGTTTPIRIGRVVDSNPGGSYPRRARIEFDSGACLVQYRVPDGLVGGGQGYIILP